MKLNPYGNIMHKCNSKMMKPIGCLVILLFSFKLSAQTGISQDKEFKAACIKAALGDSQAVKLICRHYLNCGNTGYFDASLHVLMPAAAAGSDEAAYVLGNYLFRTSRDSSIMYFTMAAKHDSSLMGHAALFALGDIYSRGLPPDLEGGVSPLRDTARAVYWYTKYLTFPLNRYMYCYVAAKLRLYSSGGTEALKYVDSCYHINRKDFEKQQQKAYAENHNSNFPNYQEPDFFYKQYEEYIGVRERLMFEILGKR
jgi:hypothetical protein